MTTEQQQRPMPRVDELVGAVEFFMRGADQTIDTFNVRQTALYIGLCLEEMSEIVSVLGLSDMAEGLDAVATDFKVGFYDDVLEEAATDPTKREELLDGSIDLAWVAIGKAFSQGAFVAQAVEQVRKANHGKLSYCIEETRYKVLRDLNGKVMKPEGWQPPSHKNTINPLPAISGK